MAEKKKKAAKKEAAPAAEKGDKAGIIQAVKDMPLASNLVVENKKYETVKREDVIELLKQML